MIIDLRSANKYVWGISEDRFNKIAIISLYMMMLFCLIIIIKAPPALGYELSIYWAYPSFFWFVFILNVTLSISFTIYFISKGSNLWKYGLIIIVMQNALIIFLPIIRGYEFFGLGGSDIFSHLALSNFILNTGHLMGSDIYPPMHILAAILDMFGIHDAIILTTLISITFYLLYILSLFILGRAIFKNEKAGAYFSVFGSPLLFSSGYYGFFPFLFALLFLPLVFYCIQKINDSKDKGKHYICIIIFSLFIVFCHPMVTIILLLILVTLFGYAKLGSKHRLGSTYKLNILNLIAIVGITFAYWYINFRSIHVMANKVVSALFGISDTETILSYNSNAVSQSGASSISIFVTLIKIYGPTALYILAALCITIYFIKIFIANRTHWDELGFGILFLLSLAFGIVLTLGYFIIFEIMRATAFAMVMATIVCGTGVYILIKGAWTIKRKQIFRSMVIIFLCTASILSIFNIYPSPWDLSPGVNVTEMEISGADWFLMHENSSIPLYSNVGPINKYVSYFQELTNNKIEQPIVILNEIPNHFGYDQNMYLSQSINNSGNSNPYMVTNELMRQSALAGLEETQSLRNFYTQGDFIRLSNDPTVNKLYMNPERELWMIQYK